MSEHGARKSAEHKDHELDAKELNVQGLLSKETKFYFAKNQNDSSSLSSYRLEAVQIYKEELSVVEGASEFVKTDEQESEGGLGGQ